MGKLFQNGSDCINEINQNIERIYISASGKSSGKDIDLANDLDYLLLKKIVEFFLKENTDFRIFSEDTFIDLFRDDTEIKNGSDGINLNSLEFYDLVKVLYVSDEDENDYYVVWLKNISQYVDDWTTLKSYYETQKRTRFKFRAEYFHDVIEFFSDFPAKYWDVKIEQSDGFPDTDCEFTTYMSLKEVLLFLKGIVDSHVMMDTLNYSEDYTGERRYYEWGDITDDEELISILNS